MEIPTINIPPRLRFALYLLATAAGLASSYFLDKNFAWWGEPEVKLTNGVIAVINLMAAVKVSRTLSAPAVEGEVLDRVDDTTDLADSAGVQIGRAHV